MTAKKFPKYFNLLYIQGTMYTILILLYSVQQTLFNYYYEANNVTINRKKKIILFVRSFITNHFRFAAFASFIGLEFSVFFFG